jgi:hypothetical protein
VNDDQVATVPRLEKHKKSENLHKHFHVDVKTFILILEMSWIDVEKKTCNVWCELGFYYDVYQFLQTFDYFTESHEKDNDRTHRLKNISPEDIQIPFDIVNAVGMCILILFFNTS